MRHQSRNVLSRLTPWLIASLLLGDLHAVRAAPAAAPAVTTPPPVTLTPTPILGEKIPLNQARRFERGSDFVFTRDAKAKITRTPVNQPLSVAALVFPDSSTYFADAPRGGRQGGVLLSKKYPRGVFYATPEVHDFAYAPSGKYLAILDDIEHSAAILSVPDGKRLRKFDDAYAMRFREDGVLLYRSKCQIYEIEPTSTAAPRPLGPKLCGGAAAATSGNVWIVVEPSHFPEIRWQYAFTSMTVIDGVNGAATPVQIGRFTNAILSDQGKRACYYLADGLYCRELSTGKLDSLTLIDPHSLRGFRWGRNDELFLLITKTEVLLVDFVQHVVRKITSSEGVRYCDFLPGGSRVYAYDKGANLYDLATGTVFEIFDKKTEVGGIFPVPNRADRFITGKEIRDHRDLYWIDVKPSGAAKSAPKK